MNAPLLWYGAGSALTALVVGGSIALLQRPLRSVLHDLLGSAARARFFTLTLCGLIASATLAGSLMPIEALDAASATRRALELNLSKQLLAAGAALLMGLGVAGGLLLILILKYEARRA